MAFAQPPSFKLGARPIKRLIAVVFASLPEAKSLERRKHFINMLSIVRPVSSNIQRASRGKPISTQLQKRRLYDAPLVVTLLGPWVGEVQIDPDKRGPRYLLLQDLNRVMSDEAKIFDAGLICGDQAMADAGLVNLDADKVAVRAFLCLLYERVAVAKTDFQRSLSIPAKQPCQVKYLVRVRKTVLRPQLLERFFLRCRNATCATHEGTYRSLLPA